ncbi:MAG TPA: alcohol dehydrogenase catalytic domain-containing protein [Terriglobales bacterium]|nr:alcohol dehydrogenase catalytic domain-containing protein [Terriglobales bacterium]
MSATSVLEVRFSSFHEEVSKPSLHGVPNGKGVLVKVLRVGVDLTDEELRGKYGAEHPGYDFLVLGHAGFGRVEGVGPNVTQLKPGDYVIATSRYPGTAHYNPSGSKAASTNGSHDERGLDFLTEYYVADAGSTIRVPDALTHVGGLLEPSPTGTAAISGKTSALLFQATVTGITPLRLNPKLPEQLEEIISKLLNKDGNLRYQGADELRNIIARLGRAAGPARIKGLRATLAWRTPGARWHFAPAGRFCMVISRLSEAPQCGVAVKPKLGQDWHLGLDWLSPETPASAPVSGTEFPMAAR